MAGSVNAKFCDLDEPGWHELLTALPGYDCFRDAAGYWFDVRAANYAVKFFESRLRHVKGPKAGQLLILERWQRALVGCIFGWKDAAGFRRYRKVFLYIPRKNGKTIIIAGMALLLMACSKEKGQEIYGAAGEKEQACQAFNMAKRMIVKDPGLSDRMQVWAESITCDDHFYKPVSAEAYSKHGFNASAILADEVHAMYDAELIDTLESSMGVRPEPLTFYATTADYDRPSLCNNLLKYAIDVRDGVYDDAEFLPIVYMAEEDDDWTSPDVWRKANPNLGISVPLAFYEKECQKAQRLMSYQNTFRRLYLNQRTSQANRWIDLGDWDGCSGLEPGETPEDWRARMLEVCAGLQCWGGLDLGSVSDLTSLTLLFDGDECGYPGAVVALPWFWCPGDSIASKEEKNQVIYQEFVARGFMKTTPGNVADYDAIREDIVASCDRFALRDMAADRLFQGAQLCTQLREDGLEVIDFRQNFVDFAAPSKDFEERIKGARLIHGGNPVLRWMAGSVMVKTDDTGNMKPIKPAKNSGQKIDGIVTAIMALGRYVANPAEKTSNEVLWI